MGRAPLLSWFDMLLVAVMGWLGRRGTPSGLVLVSSGGIGDCILFAQAAPHFAQLAAAGEPVILITQKAGAVAAFLFPPHFIHMAVDYRRFRRNWLYRARVAWRLFRLNARMAIATDYLRHPLADDALVHLSQAPHRVALSPKSWPKYDALLQANLARYTQVVPLPSQPLHRYVRWMHLPAAVLGTALVVPPLPGPRTATAITNRVVIHPFGSCRDRQPAVDWFRQLIDVIPLEYQIVLSAGPDDLGRNPDFLALLDHPRVTLDSSGFRAKSVWLAQVALVIAVDTSFLHFAAVLGANTLGLVSAAHVVDSVPYDARMGAPQVTFCLARMDCSGCLGNCFLPAVQDRYACMERLTVDHVRDIMLKKLTAETFTGESADVQILG